MVLFVSELCYSLKIYVTSFHSKSKVYGYYLVVFRLSSFRIRQSLREKDSGGVGIAQCLLVKLEGGMYVC